MDKTETAFYHGVIAALAVVRLFDAQVLFDNIVETVDEEKLVAVARKNGDMRWSGLSQYGYGKKSKKPDRELER